MESARVLVVEDTRHIAHFLQHNLAKAGYETEVVYSGDAVLPAVRSFAPHALLLDMVLPGMSGTEICTALRKDREFDDLVIIIVTGHSFGQVSADEVEATGASGLFHKPISPVRLLQKLRELGVPPQVQGVVS